MSAVLVSARVAPMDVSRAARRAGFYGTDSRAEVVRYALLRIAGYGHDDARSRAALSIADSSMVVAGTNIKARIDADLLTEIERNMPDGITDRSTLVRYALARAAEYSHDEALDEARRTIGRPKITRETTG